METKVILFASLYVLMAMFLAIYLFTSNILAMGVSIIFGTIMLVSQFYLNPEAMHRFKSSSKSVWVKIKNLAFNSH